MYPAGDTSIQVVACALIPPQPRQHDGVQRAVRLAVATAVEAVASGLAGGHLDRADQRAAGDRRRHSAQATGAGPARRPASPRHRAGAQRHRNVGAPFVAVGLDQHERDAAVERLRHQIAFYASTPSYRPVLDLHGCAKLGDRLHTMSRGGQWEGMAREVDDDVLDAVAMTGTPQEAAVRT